MGKQPPKDVIDAARDAHVKYKIPASISIAQWALESGWGKSMPASSNNPFGIKEFGNGPKVIALTREVIRGKSVFKQQPFRKYANLEAAFEDHAKLFVADRRYAKALQTLPNVAKFVGLMGAVYATDPNYAKLIMSIINGSGLTKYD